MNRVLGRVIAAVILMISPSIASAADAACANAPSSLGRFEAASGGAAPDLAFVVDGIEGGGERTVADFKGQALIVNLWATWCAPCVTEMPALNRLAAEVADAGIAVLPLSADREGAPVIKDFYAKNAITNLPVMMDPMSRFGRALGIRGLPTTILFDRDGREVGRVVGIAEWDAPEAVRFLRACLAPAA